MSEQVEIRVTDLPDARPSTPLEALEWLGDTVDEVVEGLKARGIKGKRGDGYSCPLATYLNLWWEGAIVWNTFRVTSEIRHIETPRPCHEFALKFDRGQFPELIKESNEG